MWDLQARPRKVTLPKLLIGLPKTLVVTYDQNVLSSKKAKVDGEKLSQQRIRVNTHQGRTLAA